MYLLRHVHLFSNFGPIKRTLLQNHLKWVNSEVKEHLNYNSVLRRASFHNSTEPEIIAIFTTAHVYVRVHREKNCLTELNGHTSRERISSIAHYTCAGWSVVHYTTFSIQTTRSRTGIIALVVQTCFTAITVRTDNTFWPTASVRISKIFWEANARASTVSFLAHCISTTWWRITRISRSFSWSRSWKD